MPHYELYYINGLMFHKIHSYFYQVDREIEQQILTI